MLLQRNNCWFAFTVWVCATRRTCCWVVFLNFRSGGFAERQTPKEAFVLLLSQMPCRCKDLLQTASFHRQEGLWGVNNEDTNHRRYVKHSFKHVACPQSPTDVWPPDFKEHKATGQPARGLGEGFLLIVLLVVWRQPVLQSALQHELMMYYFPERRLLGKFFLSGLRRCPLNNHLVSFEGNAETIHDRMWLLKGTSFLAKCLVKPLGSSEDFRGIFFFLLAWLLTK